MIRNQQESLSLIIRDILDILLRNHLSLEIEEMVEEEKADSKAEMVVLEEEIESRPMEVKVPLVAVMVRREKTKNGKKRRI